MTYITWERDATQYSNGELGRRGAVRIFDIHWDATKPGVEDDNNHYLLTSSLPGIKTRLGYFATIDEGKALAETVFIHFCKLIDVEAKP